MASHLTQEEINFQGKINLLAEFLFHSNSITLKLVFNYLMSLNDHKK